MFSETFLSLLSLFESFAEGGRDESFCFNLLIFIDQILFCNIFRSVLIESLIPVSGFLSRFGDFWCGFSISIGFLGLHVYIMIEIEKNKKSDLFF